MKYSISIYFLYFIILAILGWTIEIILQLITKRKFSNRGFFIGPYCPIYGCGGLLITFILSEISNHPIALFCTAVFLCGALEYLTSYFMEKLFNARWWDYSSSKYNINGRICLETLVPFGILGLALIYVINPFIFENLIKIPENILNIIAISVAILFAMDIIISFKVISNVRKVAQKFDKENPKDNTEEISQKVREFLKGKSILNKRLVDAFPELTASLKERKEKIKMQTKKVKEDIVNKASEVKEEIVDKAIEVKEEIVDKANGVKKILKKDETKNDL